MNNSVVTVKAAATSANLGGGFDCLGVALSLYHTVTARFSDSFCVNGDGDPRGRDNLIYVAMNEVFKRFGRADAAVELTSHSDIPRASGLGSSAACVVCGVSAANALLGEPLSEREKIEICAALDGHPDNVLPSIVGGVTAAYADGGKIEYIRADAPKDLIFAVATPDFGLKTEKARAVLPASYSREDCVYSLSRAAVTFGALALGKVDMLKAAGDRLHQPYRAPLIKGYDDVMTAFSRAGAIGSCLSGAGPSILAFFESEKDAQKTALPEGWTLRALRANNSPVEVKIG